MAIKETDVRGTPGWWMKRLHAQMEAERPRLELLQNYLDGRPKLPWESKDLNSKFARFQRASRTNYAEMLVEAPVERFGIRSIETAADDDEDGDEAAERLATANNLDDRFGQAARMAYTFGWSYLSSAAPAGEFSDQATICHEDPRTMTVDVHPLTGHVRAAFKLMHDSALELDIAILWLPGEKHVAVRTNARTGSSSTADKSGERSELLPNLVRVRFSLEDFEMRGKRPDDADEDDDYWSESYDKRPVPVRRVMHRDGVGVFEKHLDVLDRINHLVFVIMVIATTQAFRQRTMEQSTGEGVDPLPEKDDDGNLINYDELFEAGPDALWLLPPGASIKELGQAEIQSMLGMVKDDTMKLSAATGTPMSMFSPDAVNQSAEGVAQSRERMVFRSEAFLRTAGRDLAWVIAEAFYFMGDDQKRDDASRIAVNFRPVERNSLAQMGSAIAQMYMAVPREWMWAKVLQATPKEVRQMKVQWGTQAMTDAVAAAKATAGPTAPPNQPTRPLTKASTGVRATGA